MNLFFIVDILLFIMFIKCNERNEKLFFGWSCALMFMLTALHNGSGNVEYGYDFPEYIKLFMGERSMYGNLDTAEGYELEPVYTYFCRFLRWFGRYEFVYILGTSLFFGIPFVYLVNRYSNNKPLSFLLLFTLLNTLVYLMFLSAHRQMLANTFFLLCFAVYNSQVKYKKLIILLLALGGLFSHTSSYLVIPLAAIVYFMKVSSKKRMIGTILVSLVVGMTYSPLINELFDNLILFLSGFGELSRVTVYSLNEIYENAEISIFWLAPFSVLTILCIHYSTKQELNSICMKSLFVATIVKNLFSFVPMIDRTVLLFILLGIIGGVPVAIKTDRRFKFWMVALVIVFLAAAYKTYLSPSFRLTPFHFIFE